MPTSPLLRRVRPYTVTCVLAATTLVSQACVYDHRVTQAIIERNRRAKAAEGAHIGTSGSHTLPARYSGRLRFYVSSEYRAQHADWRRRIEDLVDAASSVLRASFGVRLEVSELHEWSPTCDAARLEGCLQELARVEPNDAHEWIVGVLGAAPRFTASFDELGMAQVPGSHFVLRDVSDLAERAAIDAGFASFTPSRRDEIYAKRKQHKRLATFLHEWAHTMGGLHTSASDALLHASYDDRMSDFDAANAGLISASLDDRFGAEAGHAALIQYLESSAGDGLDARERDELLTRLEHGAPQTPTAALQGPASSSDASSASGAEPATHAFVVKGSDDTLLAGVSVDDRAAYHVSVQKLLEGDLGKSLAALLPLVERHPSCYAVQHLACGLAMQLGNQTEMMTVCPRAQKLAIEAEAGVK